MKSSRKEQDMKEGVLGKTTTRKKQKDETGGIFVKLASHAADLLLTPQTAKCSARPTCGKGRQGVEHLIRDTTGAGVTV